MTDDEQICGAVDDKGRTVFVCVLPAGHPPARVYAVGGSAQTRTPGHYFRSLEGTS